MSGICSMRMRQYVRVNGIDRLVILNGNSGIGMNEKSKGYGVWCMG
jgi:hypothetical protein